jgi:D-alanyl-D-alanine-carboxypeptidase/D-alanyl-D-alanine-endopeptidase
VSVGFIDGPDACTVGFGSTRWGYDVTPAVSTSFQTGPVTKVFTALLLADAVRRDEVRLDQPLVTLFPEAASNRKGRPIELVDLATHTSGLPRLPASLSRLARDIPEDPYARLTIEHRGQALAVPPKRPPGSTPRYSNLGVGALGEALARAADMSYLELVRTRICGPLGLQDTRFDADDSSPDVAVGHTRRGRPTVDWQLSALAGAGALRSSVRDLLVLLRAHLDPDSSPIGELIHTVLEERARINRSTGVGLGWHYLDRRRGGSRWWWHNGGTGGFRSFVGFDPASRRSRCSRTTPARSIGSASTSSGTGWLASIQPWRASTTPTRSSRSRPTVPCPPERSGLRATGPTVASATYSLIAEHPYRFRSSEVLFTVWADRQGIAKEDRGDAWSDFFAKPRPCLRASDLPKRFGWGVHADEQGRIALYGVDSSEDATLAAGSTPDGGNVTVTAAMPTRR